MYGTFARGRAKRGVATQEELETQVALTRHGWGKDDAAYRQVFTTQMMPEATREQQRWWNDLQRASASAENAARLQLTMGDIDVADMLPRLTVPTLVLHCRGDARVPFEQGREVAALIPGARFVPLAGKNHLPQPDDPGWQPIIAEIRSFLGDAAPSSPAMSLRPRRGKRQP
jgi:pimeloyl-ACP methyl ester carboxylesterase